MFSRILFASIILTAQHSLAVINGRPESQRSTVELQVGRTQRCSAVIVGAHPLTLITAATCTRTPIEIQRMPNDQPWPQLKRLIKDQKLAILIFDQTVNDLEIPVRFAQKTNQKTNQRTDQKTDRVETVQVCGFGRKSYQSSNGVATCGTENLVAQSNDLSSFLPPEYRSQDPRLFSYYASDLRSALRLMGAGTVAVSRNLFTRYALEDSMPTLGDLGGPWWTADRIVESRLFAITTQVRTLLRRNDRWIVFNDPTLTPNDLPYVALGTRLDTVEARTLMERARSQGADIRLD